MTSDILLPIIAIVMALVIVGRRFWGRGAAPGETLRLALIWVAIIAALWAATALIGK
jgi:hypothetical protein